MKNLIVILFVAFIAACSSSTQTGQVSITELKDQVMNVHDEVMPKMGELRKTAKALKEAAEAKKAEEDMLAAEDLTRAAEAIDEAANKMMVWMRQYEPDFKGTEDEYRTYLNDQLTKVNEVKEAINGSLESGKSLIN